MKGQDEFDDILKKKLESQEFSFDESDWKKASDLIDTSRNALKDKIDTQEFPFDEANWEKASGMIDASRNALRDKLDAQEFPFDEANWKKASAMIDASRETKRRPAAIYFVAATLLLILGIGGWFLFDSPTAASANHTIAENVSHGQQAVSAPENKGSSTDASVAEKNVVSENAGHQPTTAEMKSSQKQAEANSGPTVNTAPANNRVATNSQSSPAEHAQPAMQGSTADLNSQQGKKVTSRAKTQTGIAGIVSKVGNSANPAQTPFAAPQKDNEVPAKTPDASTPVTDNTSTSTAPVKADNESPPVPASVVAADTAAQTPAAAIPAKVDTAASIAGKESKFRTEKEPRSFIYFEGGTNYLLGWKNMDEKDASGFNPVFGLHFFHMFKNNLGITAGSQYNCVGNLNYSSHTSTVTHYDFGKVDDVTIITPTRIHYVSGVLKLNYVIKKNNMLGIGCNVSYLLNVDNKVETYNQRDNHISQMQVSKTRGYVDGFNTIDVQATLSYRRKLYKDFGASIELFYGLTDVKTNGFFNTNFFERNTGMKLTLTYNIFKK